jgi:hypothetical protein
LGPPQDILWLTRAFGDVPSDDAWLGQRELAVLERFRVSKRNREWRLGRWTAKCAVACALGQDVVRSSVAPDHRVNRRCPGGLGRGLRTGLRADAMSIEISVPRMEERDGWKVLEVRPDPLWDWWREEGPRVITVVSSAPSYRPVPANRLDAGPPT